MHVEDDGFKGYAEGEGAVDGLAQLSTERMREREKTKRLLIGSVTVLVIVAAVAMLFAPTGREPVGYVLGAVLLVLALGAIGASKFLLRVPGVVLDTKDSPHEGIKAASKRKGTRSDRPVPK